MDEKLIKEFIKKQINTDQTMEQIAKVLVESAKEGNLKAISYLRDIMEEDKKDEEIIVKIED